MKCMEIKITLSASMADTIVDTTNYQVVVVVVVNPRKKNTRVNDELPFPVYLHASQYTLIYYSTICNLHHQEKERMKNRRIHMKSKQ